MGPEIENDRSFFSPFQDFKTDLDKFSLSTSLGLNHRIVEKMAKLEKDRNHFLQVFRFRQPIETYEKIHTLEMRALACSIVEEMSKRVLEVNHAGGHDVVFVRYLCHWIRGLDVPSEIHPQAHILFFFYKYAC